MSMVSDVTVTIRDYARQYAVAQSQRGVVSTAKAVRAIRLVAPDCPLSDRELADVVAEQALYAGCSVEFDVADAGMSTKDRG